MIFYDTAELFKVCQYRFRKSKRIPSSAIDEPLFFNPVFIFQGLPDSTVVKNLLAVQEVQETWVPSLGQEDPLVSEVVTYSSILAWKTPQAEEAGGLQSVGS